MELGGRHGGSRRAMSQINVTPFVDVMLVLLIIFMVTAPMLETGVEVNLPEVEHSPGLPETKEPLVVTVDRKGGIAIGKAAVENPAKLTPVIRQMLANRKGKEVFLEADRDVPYGRVVQVLAAIKKAGVERLGMVSQEPRP
ncbi:MAG: protein TolR [Deltaproteobacteria bacterium]|nr:protein TolR [Deltaproteobacteria bacterium]